jgi:hypothetical protein
MAERKGRKVPDDAAREERGRLWRERIKRSDADEPTPREQADEEARKEWRRERESGSKN